MAESAFKVEGISKRYALGRRKSGLLQDTIVNSLKSLAGRKDPQDGTEFWALRDVSFDIKAGEAVGIIGRNGAGKSTLLKVLSRITTPTEGRIEINGRVASLLEVGTGFHKDLSGRENIYLNGAILGMSRREIREKFDQIVDFSGIEKFIDTPVKRYSSGMYVRLAFAVAAHLEPEILIIDEVLAVGDAEFQKKCLGKMGDVTKKDGRTVLFVSHSMAAVNSLCTRGILMQNGMVTHDGGVDSAIAAYTDSVGDMEAERIYNDVNKAPGTDKLKLVSVRIISEDKVTGNVALDQDIIIEVTFDNYVDGARIATNLHLYDHLGSGVFSTVNWSTMTSNTDPFSNKQYSKGRFISRCVIPANYLNEGNYYINVLMLVDTYIEEFRVNEVVRFTVNDFGLLKKDFTRQWLGVVRPKLEWVTESLQAITA